MYHNLWISIGLQVLVFLCLMVVVVVAGRHTIQWQQFSHVGPCTKTNSVSLCGIYINSWTKWAGLMCSLLLVEGVNTWSQKTYKRWYRDRLHKDPLSSTQLTPPVSLAAITLWELVTFTPKAFEWFIFVSNPQLQFLLPPLFGRVAMSNLMDYYRICGPRSLCGQ
jgi:hypothetical protein